LKPLTAIAKRSLQATLAAVLTLGLSSFGATMAHAEDATTTITGTVSLDGETAAGLEVCAWVPVFTGERNENAAGPCVVTDGEGSYQFAFALSASTGMASVWVNESADYPLTSSRHFDLAPGDDVGKDIEIQSFPKVSGTVVDKVTKAPIAGAKVCAGDVFDLGAEFCDTTDAAGSYSTRAFAAGPLFTVFAEAPGYVALVQERVKAGAGLRLVLEPAKVVAAKPSIAGKVKVGKLLTAKTGKWGPEGVQLSYQWLRNGKVIRGATSANYKLVKADRGKKIKVKVTGTAEGYPSATKVSKATKKVAKR